MFAVASSIIIILLFLSNALQMHKIYRSPELRLDPFSSISISIPLASFAYTFESPLRSHTPFSS